MPERIKRLMGLLEQLEVKTEENDALKTLFYFFPGLAMIASEEGDIVAVSRGWEQAIGCTPEEMEGCCWKCMVWPEDAESTAGAVLELHDDDIFGFVNRWVHADGTPVTLKWTGASWVDVGDRKLNISVAEVIEPEASDA
jgi:PAS domain S-box-containing protein